MKIKNTLKVPVAIIQKDSLFLFQRRKKNSYKNYLGLLGGKIEVNENVEKALIREILEESSLVVKDLHFIGIVNEFLYTRNKIYKVELFIYKVIAWGKILGNSKEGDLVWVDQYELDLFRDEFIQTDWLIVKRMIEGGFFQFEIKVFENNYRYSVIAGC